MTAVRPVQHVQVLSVSAATAGTVGLVGDAARAGRHRRRLASMPDSSEQCVGVLAECGHVAHALLRRRRRSLAAAVPAVVHARCRWCASDLAAAAAGDRPPGRGPLTCAAGIAAAANRASSSAAVHRLVCEATTASHSCAVAYACHVGGESRIVGQLRHAEDIGDQRAPAAVVLHADEDFPSLVGYAS